MNWYLSDLHWGHKAVIGYTKRPFKDVDEMNEELIKRWNECVGPEDTVYVLGDMALCSFKEFEPIAARLNGKYRYLVRGNHDKFSEGQYNKLGFRVVHEVKLKIAGQMVRLSHFPYAPPWYKRWFMYKSELRYLDLRPPKIKGEWLMHGHVHSKYKIVENRLHVGVDAWNFYPVSQSELESLMSKASKNK